MASLSLSRSAIVKAAFHRSRKTAAAPSGYSATVDSGCPSAGAQWTAIFHQDNARKCATPASWQRGRLPATRRRPGGRSTRAVAAAGEASSSADADQPPPGCSRIKVQLSRPLGMVLEENKDGGIYVAEVVPGGNAQRTGLVDVGDELIATSAVVYNTEESYGGVIVRKGMEVIRLTVRGEKFDTVMAAIGTHPGYQKVTVELQKCKPIIS